MPLPKKTYTFGLYSTSKQSYMKVRSKNRHLGVRLIKMLINPPSFELGLTGFVLLTPEKNNEKQLI